ncbi:hypothetical protein BMW23_0952 [Bodo saltans virus]|uniref:Uncharacterized protein n=1 Tax=Bodo saltans virus TaxID=2024608 RepID=A0A2H4UVU8_9VIRU|nr:hypothetical protein QJ851_gp0934 [Bodo saltans virus]ATZ80997.1 hypothetical protein BMW23_0952 [Bodo saltans virus]
MIEDLINRNGCQKLILVMCFCCVVDNIIYIGISI